MYTLAGIHIFDKDLATFLRKIEFWISARKHAYICFLGAHGIVEASNSQPIKRALLDALLVVPDGMPIVWIGRLLHRKNIVRIYGPDAMLAICALAQKKKYRVFLYGTTKNTLQRLRMRLLKRYPHLAIAGSLAPPFGDVSKQKCNKDICAINAAKPHIVFVGLSTPKQELWMHKNFSHMNANILLGVGAAFDFVSGTKKQAPNWMRAMGFEWLFRLVQEPRRLWLRYAVILPKFIIQVSSQLFQDFTLR